MKLWIRSQDKKRIVKSEQITTLEFTDKPECEIFNNTVKLGKYKNIERALEILDEIDERISLLQTIELAKGSTGALAAFKRGIGEEKLKGLCCPYQMPKE